MKTNAPCHILIIEDSPDDRADIRQMLLRGSDRHYRFTEAELGAAGVRACRETAGALPDCVLLDYYLPDMNAMEVLTELRGGSELPPCPVVVLTGSDVRVGRASCAPERRITLVKAGLRPRASPARSRMRSNVSS